MEPTIDEAAGGYDAPLRLAHAWHERCLADPVASHPFGHPGQHPDHTARLATCWAEALGGPAACSDAMGTVPSRLESRHIGAGSGCDRPARSLSRT